jgi:hypothetical protein
MDMPRSDTKERSRYECHPDAPQTPFSISTVSPPEQPIKKNHFETGNPGPFSRKPVRTGPRKIAVEYCQLTVFLSARILQGLEPFDLRLLMNVETNFFSNLITQ